MEEIFEDDMKTEERGTGWAIYIFLSAQIIALVSSIYIIIYFDYFYGCLALGVANIFSIIECIRYKLRYDRLCGQIKSGEKKEEERLLRTIELDHIAERIKKARRSRKRKVKKMDLSKPKL